MSKFRYVFSKGGCELVSYSSEGHGLELIFPRGSSGEVHIASHCYPVVSGCARPNLTGYADGVYSPSLVCGEREYPLTPIKKDGNRITHPGYTTEELCNKFDEIRRNRSALRELSEKYKQLEEYVLGKGIF